MTPAMFGLIGAGIAFAVVRVMPVANKKKGRGSI
jgi:hypothetical protein